MTDPHHVLAVLGHARRESLCHRLLNVALQELERRGAEVRVHDLLADGFDPLLRLDPEARHARPADASQDPLAARYCQDVLWADAYLVIHPVWWFAPPAILKGWVDRVLVDTVAIHQPEAGPPEGLLGGRRALVVQTFNAPKPVDTLLMRNLAEGFWRRAVFSSVGVRDFRRVALYAVEGIAEETLARHETRLRRAVGALVR